MPSAPLLVREVPPQEGPRRARTARDGAARQAAREHAASPSGAPARTARALTARVVAVAAALVLGTLTGATSVGVPASAHTELRSSTPVDGATLTSAPAQIRLEFTEAPSGTAHDVAVTLAGQVVPSGPVRLEGNAVVAPATLPGPGAYTVAYRVVAGDGHPVQGTIRFTVTAKAGAAGSASPSAVAATPSAAAASKGPVPPPKDTSRWPYFVIALVILILIGIAVVLATGERPPKRKRF
jgi:copper resistance protein C